MSDDLHPDLEEFYDAIAGSDDNQWIDEDDDQQDGDDDDALFTGRGYEVYFDPEDLDDDEEYIDEDEIEEEYDEDDDEGESNQDLGEAILLDEAEEEDELDQDDGSGRAFLELASIINNVAGDDADAQTSLIARILGSGTVTRSGGNLQAQLRRLVASGGTGNRGSGNSTPEERERARKAARARWWKPQTEPDPRGQELLRSGEFGRVGDWRMPEKSKRHRPRASDRRLGGWTGPIVRPHHSQATVPNTPGTVVACYPSVPYVGQFAKEDYSIFYTATQSHTIHLYSTNEPRKSHRRRRAHSHQPSLPSQPTMDEEDEHESDYEDEDDDEDVDMFQWTGSGRRIAQEDTSLKKIKDVQGIEGQWTVTDCDADRRGEKMIYSSITPYVHMLYTAEDEQEHIELDFSGTGTRGGSMWGGYDRFGIWSIRFSADGKEVVAGAGSGRIMVYDIDAQRRTLSVKGHADDTNAVCFADESSTNILVSGSDDGYVKVWDRRSLSSSTPSGVLVGATEGITYTSPKGDGRYIVVNSKDQAARLYDLRKMRNWSEFENEEDAVAHYGQRQFDYRGMRYAPPKRHNHPKDCSVMTYRGHSVLKTLIRCHFSPRESTGQSYIYSGSADGMIHIWSLDGTVVQVLNRADTSPLRTPNNTYSDPSTSTTHSERTSGNPPYQPARMDYTVRDVAWHGYEPTLMSTSWETDGNFRMGGTIAKHEWKGLGKRGLDKLEDWVERDKAERAGRERDSERGAMADWGL